MGEPYRAAVIGLGRIGTDFDRGWSGPPRTHAGGYAAHPRFELVAGCDPDPLARERFREQWGSSVRVYSSVEKMMGEMAPDLVSVCTPSDRMPDVVERIGITPPKAVFLEKPMASDWAGAVRLAKALADMGVPAAVNYLRAWDPAHRRFFRRLREEGRPLVARALYGKGLWNFASHMVALLVQHFGGVEEAKAWTSESDAGGADPSVGFTLQASEGFPFHCLGLDGTRYALWEVDFFMSESVYSLRAAGCERRILRGRPGRYYPGYAYLAEENPLEPDGALAGIPVALDNLSTVLDDPATPLAFGWREGMKVLEILETIRRSGAEGCCPLRVEHLFQTGLGR